MSAGEGHELAVPVAALTTPERSRELPSTGPVSQLDVLGNTLSLGRTTGSLLAYDLKNTKARYAVRLPWSGFGPSLLSGAYVILTTPGQVAVVHEPR